jgi:hypothetical protein
MRAAVTMSRPPSEESVVRVVREALARGARVDIDGLGSFVPSEDGGFDFVSRSLSKIFITYVHEDAPAAERLYQDLQAAGFDPWTDRRKLLPGQNWPRAIEDAIGVSDFVIACFSNRSIRKKGGFQAEIRYALDCAQRVPLDQVFLIPARLEICNVPARIQKEVQYVDMFPHWDTGFRRILRILKGQSHTRKVA